jgi:hypothetical protein
MSVYLSLTRAFNEGALRAILSSGQAVVVHRLALMSKDGDWILRERPEALRHVLEVLEKRGARYRFGAPLDVRWMEGGWSSHLEFSADRLRVRTDFVTRPPRLSSSDLSALWREIEGADLPVVDPRRLAELKKTNREKDYAVIGELARLLADPRDRLMLSRSARDLVTLGRDHPDLVSELLPRRPLLGLLDAPIADLEAALDAERRALIHANEERLLAYMDAAAGWRSLWPELDRRTEGMPLRKAHEIIADSAAGTLPFRPLESQS